ncbi:MAG TPA: hypothetical protein VM734_24655 [Kofleriaceae bacterium]|nr:hypothetical protein [Kofleriaceae bacterium]
MIASLKSGIVLSLVLAGALLTACGDGGSGDGDGNGDATGDGSVIDDGDGGVVDDGGTGSCVPGVPECSDGCDNDGDGRIDGDDVECTGALDNDESSFSTGIPGDNRDTVNQDCFFDGDSGAGNDGCNIHVCCLLGAPDRASCPYGANQYDPADCQRPQSQQCQTYCGALTPPGCDCFGCCTVCDPATDQCYDVVTNPATAPMCDETTISDPTKCPRCTKVTNCGTTCDPDNCILCPGQTEEDLPPSCSAAECPAGHQTCDAQTACPTGQYCTNGCCIDGIP